MAWIHVGGMIARHDLSQGIIVIDMLTARKSCLDHSRKPALQLLPLYRYKAI